MSDGHEPSGPQPTKPPSPAPGFRGQSHHSDGGRVNHRDDRLRPGDPAPSATRAGAQQDDKGATPSRRPLRPTGAAPRAPPEHDAQQRKREAPGHWEDGYTPVGASAPATAATPAPAGAEAADTDAADGASPARCGGDSGRRRSRRRTCPSRGTPRHQHPQKQQEAKGCGVRPRARRPAHGHGRRPHR